MKFLGVLFVGVTLAGCANTPLGNILNNQRFQTLEDIQQSWVGLSGDELVMSWGPPQNSYPMDGGARMIAYQYLRLVGADGYNPRYEWCVQKFLIEGGIVTRWGISDGCPKHPSNPKSIPDTPVPKPTL